MKIAVPILATVATLVSLPMAAEQSSALRQYQGGMSQAEYNRCFQLALARGESVSVGEERRLNLFIDACLRGKTRPGPPAIPPPSARLR